MTQPHRVVGTQKTRHAMFWISNAAIALALTFSMTSPALALTLHSEDTPNPASTEPTPSPEQTSDPTPSTDPTVLEEPVVDTGPTPKDVESRSDGSTIAPSEETPSTDTWTYVSPSIRRPTVTATATPTAEPAAVIPVEPTAVPSSTPTPKPSPTGAPVITEVDYTTASSIKVSPLAMVALTASLVLAALLGGWALLYKLRYANQPAHTRFRRR